MKNKKVFISLLIICLAVILIFNILFFVTPINKEYSNASIWISFVCSNVSIVISFITSLLVLNKRNIKINIFGFPLIKESLIFTILCILYSVFAFSFGSVHELKTWITITVEIVLYCGFVIFITLSLINKKHIETVGLESEIKCSFKKELTSRLNDIVNRNKNDELNEKFQELLDAVDYIDPVSIKETEQCEDQILAIVYELENSVKKDDFHLITDLIDEITKKIQNRKNILISNRK